MVKESDIKIIFSKELKLIKDKTLRDNVIKVWKEASERGRWGTLKDVPFTLLFENSGLLTDHTKRITKLAKNISDIRDEKLNKDYLIAGALLHDVGKLLEYELSEDRTVIKSELGKQKRHPVSGSEIAKELGLPDQVVHIIYAHSKEGDNLERTPEAIIVHHCDFIDFEIKKTIKNKRDE